MNDTRTISQFGLEANISGTGAVPKTTIPMTERKPTIAAESEIDLEYFVLNIFALTVHNFSAPGPDSDWQIGQF